MGIIDGLDKLKLPKKRSQFKNACKYSEEFKELTDNERKKWLDDLLNQQIRCHPEHIDEKIEADGFNYSQKINAIDTQAMVVRLDTSQNLQRPKRYLLRVLEGEKLVKRFDTACLKKFLLSIKKYPFAWKKTKVYLKVTYEDGLNDMDCLSEKDLIWGIGAFIDEYID